MLRAVRLHWLGLIRLLIDLARLEPLWTIVLGVAAAGWLVSLVIRPTGEGASLLVTATLFVLLLTHGRRHDTRLLRLAGLTPWRVYALEYEAAAIPVAVLLAAMGAPAHALALAAAAPTLALLPAGGYHLLRRRLAGRAATPVPVRPWALEWVAGFRRGGLYWLLPALYALAVVVSAVVAGPVVVLLLTTLVLCGLYTEAESWPLVQAAERSPHGFLRGKLATALTYGGVAVSPIVLIAVVRNPAQAWVVGLALVGSAAMLAGSVLAKYASYRGRAEPGVVAGLVPVVMLGGVVVPPIGAFLLWRFWRTATDNLAPYLDAYD